jgi:hypothetical protein
MIYVLVLSSLLVAKLPWVHNKYACALCLMAEIIAWSLFFASIIFNRLSRSKHSFGRLFFRLFNQYRSAFAAHEWIPR